MSQKYLKDMETLYQSLAITDIFVKDPLQTTDTFRPAFKITNLTDRTLEVPLKQGLPPDRACVLGKATCTIRLIDDANPKGGKTVFFRGFGTGDLYPALKPNESVIVVPPAQDSIKGLGLQSGDYEITLDYGIKNGPKVKPATKKFRIVNNLPVLSIQQKAADSKSYKEDYAKFCRSIFAVVNPVEIKLSLNKVKAGAPLTASFTLSKAAGRPFPDEDALGKRFVIIFTFRLLKGGETRAQAGAWRESLFIGSRELDMLRKEGRIVKDYTVETSGLPTGSYDIVSEVTQGEEADNAPRPQKQRVMIVK